MRPFAGAGPNEREEGGDTIFLFLVEKVRWQGSPNAVRIRFVSCVRGPAWSIYGRGNYKDVTRGEHANAKLEKLGAPSGTFPAAPCHSLS